MSDQPILDALRTLAEENPERADEILQNLQDKWATLDDDQKAQVMDKLASVRDQVADMSIEDRQAIADQILSF